MAQTTQEPLGKVEQMLVDMINGEPIVEAPENRIEGLLMELADAIEQGGGGGVTGVKGSAESTYRKGNVSISKDNIGLENVDNTSDLNKPVSTAQQTALDGKVDKVAGKGLSTNDYTNTDKELVSTIPTLAPISLVKDTVGWTGKNLIGNPEFPTGTIFTIQSDNSIKFNGTPSTDFFRNYGLSKNNTNYTHIIPVEIGKKYIISGCPDGGSGSGQGMPTTYGIRCYAQLNDDSLEWLGTDFGDGVEVTIPNNTKYVFVQIAIKSGIVLSDTVFYPMIRKADITDPAYEPYHESVEVMYEEEIHGVNLFNDSKIEVGKAWNGDTNANRARNIIPCEPNSEYIVSMNGTNGLDAIFFSVSASFPPASQTAITSFPYTIRTGASDRYITLGFNKTNIALSDVTALKIMLRKAEIEDSTYRPYNLQAIQNQLNAQGVLGAKNLLENTGVAETINGITFTLNSDGSVTAQGTPTGITRYSFTRKVNNEMDKLPSELVGKSVIVSGGYIQNNGTLEISCITRNSSGQDIVDHAPTNGAKERQFTIESNAVYIRIYAIFDRNENHTPVNVTMKPMLRLASDPDDTYQPYAMTNRELSELKRGTITAVENNYATFQSGSFVRCQGRVVQLFMFIDVIATTTDNTYITVASLPYKPCANTPLLLPEWGDRTKAIQIQLYPSGDVQIRPRATGTFILSATYLMA